MATTLLALMWASVTVYALLAGADFGAGAWDLLSGRTGPGARRRALIEHAIGPVWEANHVWLIFVLVLMWTAFPPLFAAVSSTLYIPLTLVALGVIARGSAFAFRKAVTEVWQQRIFGAAFAFSSLVTPFFLGAVAGGVASGRVPPGVAGGNVVTSWLNPTSVLSGALAVVAGMYLAAVYLTADARRYLLVRVSAALAVAAVLWGWGAAQYPHLLSGAPGLTVAQAAAGQATLQATTISVGVGIVLLIPSLAWLFLLFQRSERQPPAVR